jgi:hypothetical protein
MKQVPTSATGATMKCRLGWACGVNLEDDQHYMAGAAVYCKPLSINSRAELA